MKKIFLESHHIDNLTKGFGQFAFHLLKGLYDAKDLELEFTVHTKNPKSLKTHFPDYFTYKKYLSIRRYPFARIRAKYDLWHSLNQNTKIEPRHDLPYLLTVHNTSYIQDETTYMSKENNIHFQEKLNRSTAIAYISNYAKISTHKYFDVPKVPEFVIYNGNPIRHISLKEDYQPKFKPPIPYLFTIGEITERKNFASLLPFLAKTKDLYLLIAGKKNTRTAKSLEDLIQKYRLTNRVKLIGKISEMDKQYYYKNCEAFVFPSLREGFGLPVIEAMRFGKPVFISNTTSLPEIGGDYAFYWDNYDPEQMLATFEQGLSKFYDHKEQYVDAMQKHAASFTWEKAAAEYIRVYKLLTGR